MATSRKFDGHHQGILLKRRIGALLPPIDNRTVRALMGILLLALLLDCQRLWFAPISLNSGETSSWWPIVEHVEDGDGYTGCLATYFPSCRSVDWITAAREPVPVLLFAGASRVMGDSLRAMSGVEIVLNLVIVVGIFALTRQVASDRAALFAALIWSLYLPPVTVSIAEVSGDLLAGACVTWGLALFLRSRRSGQTGV